MKKKCLPLLALLLAVTLVSFKRSGDIYYLIYSGSGSELSLTNYSWTQFRPSHAFVIFSAPSLNWFRAEDPDWDGLDDTDLYNSFQMYNSAHINSNTLSDEFFDISGQLDLWNKP